METLKRQSSQMSAHLFGLCQTLMFASKLHVSFLFEILFFVLQLEARVVCLSIFLNKRCSFPCAALQMKH